MSNPYQEALGATLIERSKRERIVIVGVTLPGSTDDDTEAGLDELELLVDTAGADVVARLTQRRDAPDHTWYIGKGKVDELREICLAVDADTVVFDNELSPGQQFNLEKVLGRTALDRTAVILDIFGQNAHTLEGKAQVELALLRYRLPRLRRGNKANLSQQSGGIGTRTRGKGETKLEVDRRSLMRRITRLEHDLAQLRETRQLQRKSRARSGLAAVTIVGYTNAGKSTLFNALTRADVRAEDRLFATLDATTRRLVNEQREVLLLTDTVGFIRKLPHHLVASFRSTLAEVVEADLWLHVVDAADPGFRGHIRNVEEVLASLAGPADSAVVARKKGAAAAAKAAALDDPPPPARPTLLVFNKVDAIADDPLLYALPIEFPGSLQVSAKTGEGLAALRARLWQARRDARAAAAAAAASRRERERARDAGDEVRT
jgi:GTP-binding protein HflX